MRQELHVLSDASDQAIGHVEYLLSIVSNSKVCVAFISCASNVAPKSAFGTSRLELCAAVEAARCSFVIASGLG